MNSNISNAVILRMVRTGGMKTSHQSHFANKNCAIEKIKEKKMEITSCCIIFLLAILFIYFLSLAADADFRNELLLPRSHARLMAGNAVVVQSTKDRHGSDLVVLSSKDAAVAVEIHKNGGEVCVITDNKDSTIFQRLYARGRCAWNGIPHGPGKDFLNTFSN